MLTALFTIIDVQKALKDLKEESSDRRRNKRAKTSNHEVITIEDD